MAEKKLEELQETHSEMLATAIDIDLDVPEELKADFQDPAVGRTILSSLDTLIREHRAKNGLAAEDEAGHTESSSKPTKSSAPKKTTKKPTASKPAKKQAPKKAATTKQKDTAADAADPDPNSEEKKVASKPAKKAAKKKAAKKSASKNARTPTAKFDEKAKIVKTGKDNPAREGSGKFQRIANVLAHNGKTVATYLTKGKKGTLAWCVKNGLVKVA